MTSTQYYVSIGIPFITILVVWIGIAVADRKAYGHLSKSINKGIDDLRSDMRAGFESVNQHLDRLEATLDRIDNEIRADRQRRLARLEERAFAKVS